MKRKVIPFLRTTQINITLRNFEQQQEQQMTVLQILTARTNLITLFVAAGL